MIFFKAKGDRYFVMDPKTKRIEELEKIEPVDEEEEAAGFQGGFSIGNSDEEDERIAKEGRKKKHPNRGAKKGVKRTCKSCGKVGHTAKTCTGGENDPDEDPREEEEPNDADLNDADNDDPTF